MAQAPLQHQQAPTFPWQTFAPANTNAGIPYALSWQPPFFPKKMPVNQMQTEAFVWNPTLANPPVSGIAWWYPFDQPAQVRVPSFLQQTEMRLFEAPQAIDPGLINAWYKGWEPPYFPKVVKAELQQTSPAYGTTFALPVKISGMAWYRDWVPPHKPKMFNYLQQQTEAWTAAPQIFKAPVSGIAWWYPFDQPKQVKVPVQLQQTTMQTNRFFWQGSVRVFILGGGR